MIISKFKNFTLEKLYPRLYLLRFEDYYDMCMTFLRYQEKYESPNPKFRGKDFTIIDFMEWYSKNKNGSFTYTIDWGGFNLPDTVFKGNWYYSIPDKNKYDIVMLDVYYTIWSGKMSEIPRMKRVIVESPYAGDIEKNMKYVRACMRDCLLKGESPYASHALYTQEGVLRDEVQEERMYGIAAGFAWREVTDYTVVYTDLGISKGMEYGIAHAKELGHPIVYRTLGEAWDK